MSQVNFSNIYDSTLIFSGTVFQNPNTLASTEFCVNYSWGSNTNGNWTKARVFVDTDQGTINSGTIWKRSIIFIDEEEIYEKSNE